MRIDVVKKNGKWVGEHKNHKKVASGAKKSKVVDSVARSAKSSDRPTSVRIHKKNGQIQEERTYPRSADPKPTKG